MSWFQFAVLKKGEGRQRERERAGRERERGKANNIACVLPRKCVKMYHSCLLAAGYKSKWISQLLKENISNRN